MDSFASDLSQQVLERRRLRNELTAKVTDDRCLPVHLLPQIAIDGRRFVADPDWGQPEGESFPAHVRVQKG
jgi:hypothetical protein